MSKTNRGENARSVTYPVKRAILLSKQIKKALLPERSDLLCGTTLHGEKYLREICTKEGIRVVERRLPGNARGAIIDVEGTQFIVLGRRAVPDDTNRAFVLGHELAHAVLGHIGGFNPRVAGYSETMRTNDRLLQRVYHTERELEADLLSMMILMTDECLDAQVEKTIYIPASRIASRLRLGTEVAVARIELYRHTFGYARSDEIRRERNRLNLSLGGSCKIEIETPGDAVGLVALLPTLDKEAARLLPGFTY